MVSVIGVMGFAVGVVVAVVCVGVGRGGWGGPLEVLCFGVWLSLTTWDCWRLMVGAHNHTPYCWSLVRTVSLLSV